MRTSKFREIEVKDDRGNLIGVFDDVNSIVDQLDISRSALYNALSTSLRLKKKKFTIEPRLILEKKETRESMRLEVPLYAKRYAHAKDRQERLKVRSEFCEKFRNVVGYDRYWSMISLGEVDYDSALKDRRDLSDRRKIGKPVVQLDRRGNVINRYKSILEASEDLCLSRWTIMDYLKGKVQKPQVRVAYGEDL